MTVAVLVTAKMTMTVNMMATATGRGASYFMLYAVWMRLLQEWEHNAAISILKLAAEQPGQARQIYFILCDCGGAAGAGAAGHLH